MDLQVARVSVPILGAVCIAASKYGVVRVHLGDELQRFQRELLSAWPGAVFHGPGPVTRAAARAILAYLAGGPDPKVETVLPEEGFASRVWREIGRIPRGQTRSYARIAKAVRSPAAFRAVGQACGKNPVPLLIPCHRVISADGRLGGFSSDLAYKRKLLELEGVKL